MSRSQNTLSKVERITNKGEIDALFTSGYSSTFYPIKVIFLEKEDLPCSRILISVPKRNFKSAVDRNLLKRRIREAHRKHKLLLDKSSQKKYLIAYIYLARKILDYKIIEEKLIDSLDRLQKEHGKKVRKNTE